MRFKVETLFGYVSYNHNEYDKAIKLYAAEGIRLYQCKNIHDPGIILDGLPAFVDTKRRAAA